MIQIKTFEADDLVAATNLANTFLASLNVKDILDTFVDAFSSAKYGTAKTYVISVVYKVEA